MDELSRSRGSEEIRVCDDACQHTAAAVAAAGKQGKTVSFPRREPPGRLALR